MFNNGLVASIKVNGEILREHKSEVYLPFNSIYEVYLKNTTSKTAKVDIFVDNREVISGLLLYPYRSTTISRFYEGNSENGHSLKFIEMTEKISNHRGSFSGDGLLKVKWQYEVEHVSYPKTYKTINPYPQSRPITWTTYNSTTSVDAVSPSADAHIYSINSFHCGDDTYEKGSSDTKRIRTMRTAATLNMCDTSSLKSDGITVNGAPITQGFTEVYDRRTYESLINEIILVMKGETEHSQITTPVSSRRKIQCEICGTKNDSINKHCRECGSYIL